MLVVQAEEVHRVQQSTLGSLMNASGEGQCKGNTAPLSRDNAFIYSQVTAIRTHKVVHLFLGGL